MSHDTYLPNRGAKHTSAAGAAAPQIIFEFCTTNNRTEKTYFLKKMLSAPPIKIKVWRPTLGILPI